MLSPKEKYCNKAFIICTELCMLPYQSKLSITTGGPSCYLLLFKSENSKRVRLAQASNLPAKLSTWERETITHRGKAAWSTVILGFWSQTVWLEPPDLPLTNWGVGGSYLTALNLIFFICKMVILAVPVLTGLLRGINEVAREKTLSAALARNKKECAMVT